MRTIYCLNCGTELPNSARFCSSCGTKLPVAEIAEVFSPIQQKENSQTTTGPTIVVEPGSLESAVHEAQAGAVLHLTAGEHHLSHPLELNKPLSLIGDGRDNTGVFCDGEAYVVKLVGDGPFVVYDLTFGHYGSQWAQVVDVAGGEIDIHRCRFTGGVEEDDPGNRGGGGLRLGGQTRGLVANCEAVGNMYGISIEDRAQPTLEANICQENRFSGIDYKGSSTGIARQNTCQGSFFGIYVDDQAQPMLEANVCQQNVNGISFAGSSNGTARQNDCSGNSENGMTVGGQAQPTLEANTCHENMDNGIAYAGSAAGVARQNTCKGHDLGGIYVSEQAQPTLEANTCQENGNGIIYFDTAAGIARQNICTANVASGITLHNQAQPTLEANACQHQQNEGNGIVYSGSAAGIARRNDCSANEGSGIVLTGQAQPTLEANTCQQNRGAGIVYDENAAGIARHNDCSANGYQGIIVAPTAQPILEDNLIYLSSDQSERVLHEFPIGGAILYDGRPNFFGGCECTITDQRLIIRCNIGGTQQVLFRDITNISTDNRFLRGHSVVIKLPGATLKIDAKESSTNKLLFH